MRDKKADEKLDRRERRRFLSSTPKHRRNLQGNDRELIIAYGEEEYEEYDVTMKTKIRVLSKYRNYCQKAIDDILFIARSWADLPPDQREGKTQLAKIFNDLEKCLELLTVILKANEKNLKLKLKLIATIEKVWNEELIGDRASSVEPLPNLIEIKPTIKTDSKIILEGIEDVISYYFERQNFDVSE